MTSLPSIFKPVLLLCAPKFSCLVNLYLKIKRYSVLTWFLSRLFEDLFSLFVHIYRYVSGCSHAMCVQLPSRHRWGEWSSGPEAASGCERPGLGAENGTRVLGKRRERSQLPATSQPLRGCVAEPLKAPPLHIAVGLGYSRRHSSCSSLLCIDFSRDTFGGHFGRAVSSKASRNRVKLLRAAVKHFRVHAGQAHSKMITSQDFSISLILQGFLNRWLTFLLYSWHLLPRESSTHSDI